MNFYATKISDKGDIAVDDTLLVKDVLCTAGSNILQGFTPLFSAEAVTRLVSVGYTISGKTHVGEFGLDLVGEFSNYSEKTDTLKGAAAELVKEGKVKAALGVDVNGAPRRAASISGVDFLKSTYGTVSRYGVVSTAASGEAVGVYAKDAVAVGEIMSKIAGYDSKDGTCQNNEFEYDYSATKDIKGKKVCIITELYEKCDDAIKAKIDSAAKILEKNGVQVDRISSDIFSLAATAWQILYTAETCNNLSRYDGVKYGLRAKEYKNIDELYVNSRTEGFNFLTKAVILYGSDVLSKNRYKDCYDKALRVRRVVAEQLAEILKTYSAVLTPACSAAEYSAYNIADAFSKVFGELEFTAIANLTGNPALVSSGVQFIGDYYKEGDLLCLANAIERMGE
ncbi:MAG: hypothetical protein IJN65_02300 [Clostridia bacterium]|nr:hypothetical protein [Clostridia bacterium]